MHGSTMGEQILHDKIKQLQSWSCTWSLA